MTTAKNKVTVQLLGAAGVVTGSKYLIKAFDKSILIDCGLFQGLKELRLLNWEPFPVDASTIDLVLLTHGHLDHTGYLPKLVNSGFEGEIWATAPTLDVTSIILKDSARVQEEDAERANAENFSKHTPAKPLYDLKDVEKTLPHFCAKPLDEWIKISDNISCRYRYNGHIIGATFIELKIGERMFVFSGDIGRKEEPLMRTPEQPDYADVLFIESTYGNRIHSKNPEEELSKIINENSTQNGTIIIPSFAVERTQLLMYTLWQLRKKNLIPNIPVYMDSPMGLNVLEVFIRHNKWHKLSLDDCYEMCSEIRLVKTLEETLKIAGEKKSKIIIAGSGMATGGRVLTYLQQYIGDASATILLAGYQAEGTRGRRLLEGEKKIKLYGKFYSVRAKIENLKGLSAHADKNELIDWMSKLKNKPQHIFITHGELDASIALRNEIEHKYGWHAHIPHLNETLEIDL